MMSLKDFEHERRVRYENSETIVMKSFSFYALLLETMLNDGPASVLTLRLVKYTTHHPFQATE